MKTLIEIPLIELSVNCSIRHKNIAVNALVIKILPRSTLSSNESSAAVEGIPNKTLASETFEALKYFRFEMLR